jgi:hypothetical protein
MVEPSQRAVDLFERAMALGSEDSDEYHALATELFLELRLRPWMWSPLDRNIQDCDVPPADDESGDWRFQDEEERARRMRYKLQVAVARRKAARKKIERS